MPTLSRRKQDDGGDPPTLPTILTEIEVIYFKAEPSAIGPFGSTTISWRLSHVTPEVTLRINNITIQPTGSMVVSPRSNSVYQLIAFVGEFTIFLGTVNVTVNTAACTRLSQHYLAEAVHFWLAVEAPDMLGLQFKNDWNQNVHVVVTDGNIHFYLEMTYAVGDIPDPHVNITCDFGFSVVPDPFRLYRHVLKPVIKKLVVDVGYNWWQWIEIGAEGPAFIAATMAEASATDAGKQKTPGMVNFIVQKLLQATPPPAGTDLENAVITAGSDGLGVATFTFCTAIPPLKDM